jgi:hypothetical protein
LVISDAIKFILQSKEAAQLISSQLQNIEQLRNYFCSWVQQKQLTKLEDVLLVCSPNLRQESSQEEKVIELFKTLFKQLLYEYLRKHSFCDSIRDSHSDKRLEISRDLLHHILKPKEFYEFK